MKKIVYLRVEYQHKNGCVVAAKQRSAHGSDKKKRQESACGSLHVRLFGKRRPGLSPRLTLMQNEGSDGPSAVLNPSDWPFRCVRK